MAKILITDREGVEHRLDAKPGQNVMEITRDAGLPVEAICGGKCICTTCHIYVDKAWLNKLETPSDDEQALIEDSGSYEPNSRLGCQITFKPELDGLKAKLAPEF